MTVGEWLAERTPVPPEPLAVRLKETLGATFDEPAGSAHEIVMRKAELLLAELLHDCAGRDRAIDLLAVDALVTYAFEAAADAPDTLASRATSAMSAIAKLVPPAHA